jgi:hypothetical protein
MRGVARVQRKIRRSDRFHLAGEFEMPSVIPCQPITFFRPLSLHRKGSLGTWSDAGARFLERAMTVAATAKLQGVRLLDFLHAACSASLTQQAPPSLFAAAN